MLQTARSKCWDNEFYRIPIWYWLASQKKSFIIDLELDIITQEIDSKLEMNTTSHKNVTGFIFHFHGISKPWDKFLTWLFVISSILSLSVLLFYVLLNFLLPNSIHHFLLLKTKICLFLHARAIVLCHDIMKYFDSNKNCNIEIKHSDI